MDAFAGRIYPTEHERSPGVVDFRKMRGDLPASFKLVPVSWKYPQNDGNTPET